MRKNCLLITALVLLAAGFLSGCAKRGVVKKTSTPVAVAVEKGREKPVPVPETPLIAVEGKKEDYASFTRPAKRLDVSLKDADLKEVLFSLAKEDGFQLIVEPDIKGTVSLDMKDVTPLEVISEICSSSDLYCTVDGKIVRVGKKKKMTRIFYLDYLITAREGTGSLNATTSTTTTQTTGTSTATTTTGTGTTSGGEENQSENTVSTSEKMDLWGTVKEELKKFLSEEGKLSVVPETGMVTVTDYPENLELLEEYLSAVEGRLKGQVLIEAKILEVLLDDSTKYGINWSAIADLSALNLRGNLAGGATFSQELSTGSSAFQFGVASTKVDVLLDAIAQQGQVNLLSSPRVSTLNNQKAIIRIGTQDVFFRAVITPATQTTAQMTTFSPETITEGIILSVTPQIGRDGMITLAIHPSISERTGTAVAPDGNTAPIIDIRETNTVISVRDGETVFIGGLIQDRTSERITSVPLLGDIPFLGTLFRKTEQEKVKSELVILLTPHVVTEGKMREVVARESERILRSKRGFHLGGRPWLYGTEGERKLVW